MDGRSHPPPNLSFGRANARRIRRMTLCPVHSDNVIPDFLIESQVRIINDSYQRIKGEKGLRNSPLML